MSFLRDVVHIVGNMKATNALWHDVRLRVLGITGVDVERLPRQKKMNLYSFVRRQYLDGNTSVKEVADAVTLHLL